MENRKFTAIMPIAEMDRITVGEARKIILEYKNKGIVTSGVFDDDKWVMCDEYANYGFDFSIDSDLYKDFFMRTDVQEEEFKEYLKAFILCQMGEFALTSLRSFLHDIKEVAYCATEDLEELITTSSNWSEQVSDFFATLPIKNDKEKQYLLHHLDDATEKVSDNSRGKQRSLAAFESYFRFDEIIKQFWEESDDEDEKLFFFPIYFWWHISGVLPLRPREVVLTPRSCLKEKNGKYYLTVRRNIVKGTGKTKGYRLYTDYSQKEYQIPEKLAKQVTWYLEKTEDSIGNELNTLFVTETHYSMWKHAAPYTSRYFTYTNLRTCLRYFFDLIVKGRYGYKILFENKRETLSDDKEIEYLHLGDTRHIALINLVAQGTGPVVAMMLAGHDDPDMFSHYSSNITTLIECRTYREYKKMSKGIQNYSLSGPHTCIKLKEFTELEKGGRCYSEKVRNGDFSDCIKASGPAGEIGLCKKCLFYRNTSEQFTDTRELYRATIRTECDLLEETVKKVRLGKGDPEEIISVLQRLRDSDYSYQQYLLEKMEEENDGKTQNN